MLIIFWVLIALIILLKWWEGSLSRINVFALVALGFILIARAALHGAFN